MKKQILSLIALVLVGIFVIGCTRGGVEEAAAVPPDGDAMNDDIANDIENDTVSGTEEEAAVEATQDTTGTTY